MLYFSTGDTWIEEEVSLALACMIEIYGSYCSKRHALKIPGFLLRNTGTIDTNDKICYGTSLI